jgi:hypothetical protein
MATPRLFKPFHHVPTKQIYTAAEPAHSNPVALANNERKLIWSEPSVAGSTDLLVSLGTGLEAEPVRSSDGSVRTTAPSVVVSFAKFGPKRERNKRASSPSQSQITSDDFLERLPISDPRIRFSRFTPISMIGVPAADDVGRMKPFQNMARLGIEKQQIKNLAAELLAALFYFEGVDDIMELANGRSVAEGALS